MPLKTHQDDLPVLNLTPMIDVVFLLIIFFMVATKFVEIEHDIDLELPDVAAAAPSTPAPKQRVVSVRADGTVALDGQALTLEELPRPTHPRGRRVPGHERRDPRRGRVPFPGRRRRVGSACKDAHVSELGITVRIADASVRSLK